MKSSSHIPANPIAPSCPVRLLCAMTPLSPAYGRPAAPTTASSHEEVLCCPAMPDVPPELPVPSSRIRVEDDRTGMHPVVLRRAFTDHIQFSRSRDLQDATAFDRYVALALSARDRLVERWAKTQRTYYEKNVKRAYYLSAEFLLGRALETNLQALGIYDDYRKVLRELGIDLDEIIEREPDAGLGNGGLGRLAACLMESMATLGLPGYGYGIRYEFGIFDQVIRNGYQVERADQWLRFGNPWEI